MRVGYDWRYLGGAPRRTRSLQAKYFRREYLWDRVKLSPRYRVSFWRLGGRLLRYTRGKHRTKVGGLYV